MRLTVLLLVLVGMVSALTSCRYCTLIGCSDTLSLEVRGPDGGLADEFSGTVTLDGEDQLFACPAPIPAPVGVMCADAGLVTLDLSWIGRQGTSRNIGQPRNMVPVHVGASDGGLSWSRTIQSPSTRFANGPECGPECISHSEQVVL